MNVTTMAELKQAVKEGASEIVITDPGLAYKIGIYNTIRTVANILVFIIFALAVLVFVDPFHWEFLRTDAARTGQRVLLGVGLLLLFLDYFLPVVRQYRIVSKDENGVRLVPRRRK